MINFFSSIKIHTTRKIEKHGDLQEEWDNCTDLTRHCRGTRQVTIDGGDLIESRLFRELGFSSSWSPKLSFFSLWTYCEQGERYRYSADCIPDRSYRRQRCVCRLNSDRRGPFGESKSFGCVRLPCHIYARCSPPHIYRLTSIVPSVTLWSRILY